MSVWHIVSIAVIFCTIILQVINFKRFHGDGDNPTRITLMLKEGMFMTHVFMLMYGKTDGMFFCLGVIFLFIIYVKGYFK